MAQLLLKLRTWWETADRTQKVVTVFGGVLLTVILGVTMMIAGKPHYQVLFSDLSPADQGSVTAELTKLAIPYDNDRAGTVRVPEDKIAEANAKLALAGKLPATGHMGGMDGLKDMSITMAPEVQKEKINSLKQEQLASAIEQMDAVGSASVILTPKKDSPFLESVDPAKASVLIKEKGEMSREQVQAVRSMVQRSVDGLDPKNISIVSNVRGILFDGTEEAGPGSASNQRREQERQEARYYEQNLQSKLAAVLGPDNVIVTVPSLELNLDQADEHKIEHPTGENPVTVETASEKMENGKDSQTAVGAGMAANQPDAAPASPNTDKSNQKYDHTQTAKEFPTNTIDTHTTKAPGNITKMAISVMVSDKVKDITPVQAVVDSWIAPYKSDAASSKNFVTTVTQMPFDTSARAAADKAAASQGSASKMQQILSLLPIAALIFVGMMVVKAIGKTAKSNSVLVTANADGTYASIGAGAQGLNAGAASLPAGSGAVGDLSSSEQALALVEGGQSDAHRDPNIVYTDNEEVVEIGNIPSKMHIPLEQLKKLAKDRPENVAMLLKSWILEER